MSYRADFYEADECRCDDPMKLFWCYMHEHWSADCRAVAKCKADEKRRAATREGR